MKITNTKLHKEIATLSSGAYYEKPQHFWEKLCDVLKKYGFTPSTMRMPPINKQNDNVDAEKFTIPLCDEMGIIQQRQYIHYSVYRMPITGAYEIVCYLS